MKLLIVTGVSGSGKSNALNILEDLGWYCVDNLPIGLLVAFAAQMRDDTEGLYRQAAIGIDARNVAANFSHFPALLDAIRGNGIACEILFLDADDATLLKRFSETRRKHPLSRADIPLAEAINTERRLLDPLASQADWRIDTTRTNTHQLSSLINSRLGDHDTRCVSLLFVSFGYKHGLQLDADFVFDVRCLPNPHWDTALRPLTGLDEDVQAFLAQQPSVEAMFQDLSRFLDTWVPRFEQENRSYLTVAIGCTGGQHRSVYLVERLARHFRALRSNVLVRHRELVIAP